MALLNTVLDALEWLALAATPLMYYACTRVVQEWQEQ